MGIEKQGSKGGNYVGGFLQMFDWNAKSRKKLFSSKSDIPEQSKQKKRCDGNLPTTRIQMLDEDENAAGSSVKESSDYSCASSVIDEDIGGTRAPGVVARLMGLDSLPKSNMPDPCSTPLFYSQSLRDAYYYQTKNHDYRQDQIMRTGSLQGVPVCSDTEPKYQKLTQRPIEKFQTEILPPKSAKSIPITHHKLLSPIKSATFIPPKDAAHIMEVAAKIIEPGPQVSTKMKLPTVGSSSVPLKVRDLREKVQAAQKELKLLGGSQSKSESSAVRNLRGHSVNKSWNASVDATSQRVILDSEESSVGAGHKIKSVSLALQAKANVQKREGIIVNSSRSLVSQKEPGEVSPNQLFKCQSTTQKSTVKKQSTRIDSSSVLRQNNQKQNCIPDRGKLPSKCSSKGVKTINGESASARQRNSSKHSGTSKVISRKSGSDIKDDNREVSSSSSERITRKKRSVDGNYHSEKSKPYHDIRKDKNGKSIQSGTVVDRQSSWDQDTGRTGTDVISFTFTAPMTRSGPGSGAAAEAGENCKIFTSGKRSLLSSDGACALKFSFLGHNVTGGDALSTLLEQKLKELTHKVEFSQQKSGKVLNDVEPAPKAIMSSTIREQNVIKDKMHRDNLGLLEDIGTSDSNISQARKLLDCRLPSPVSVLEHFSLTESCNSSDTADSNSTGGRKQCSLVQAQQGLDSYSMKKFLPIEGDSELSDSASSSSAGTEAKKQETTINLIDSGKRRSWELEYVKEILCNIELMFEDYALGRAHEIINPDLFDQLGSWRGGHLKNSGDIPRINQRILFDCVSESLDMRCRQYVSGGFELWVKGLSEVRRKERLAEEVYKEISGWSVVGDSVIDELVDNDMSSLYGKWLNFDKESFELGIQIESRILNSLVDEVITDMLML